MANMKFTESHEWAQLDAATGEVTVGITAFAVEHLGDIVFLELPASGAIAKGASFGTIESVKSASDLYSPVSGQIVAVNTELTDSLDKLPEDPYGKGWMIRVKPAKPAELDTLMDEAAYQDYLKTQE